MIVCDCMAKRPVILKRSLRIPVGRSEESAARIKWSATEKLWVTRGERWVPTVTEGPGRIRYLVISNIGEEILRLVHRLDIGQSARSPGFVSVGSRRYREWQNLALESTVDTRSEPPEPIEDMAEPAVQRTLYPTPRSILGWAESADMDRDRTLISTLESRPRAGIADAVQIEAEFPDPEGGRPSTPTTSPDVDRYLSDDAEGGEISESMRDQATNRTGTKDIEPKTENPITQIKLDPDEAFDVKFPIHPPEGVEPRDPLAEGATATAPQDAEDDEEIYYHESGDLSAEDLEGNLAVLPEIPISTTAKVSIDDLHVGDSGSTTPEEIEKLRPIIWKKQHLLIDKRNALPPVARGVVCVFDVGNARPIALRTRKVPTRFREKVAGLIKGLLAAEIIRPSTSPWASPIVIVRKSNGVDIRLCIDYKLPHEVDGLPYALVSDLLEDLDKALWYCSLDMASGFWVVPMTDRAREISAFITPFGLFE
ncbi:LOW QUALITY PROTEIN: reverse transcriptase [Phytophthora megakarya]|uniref:Reverse transcriptase n=1 Tax=Phytophthora megakarya TaxID=4795 RepID=A0A225WB86_9STRA|nr:LOW QUALITY PROTEIN: reverse transcriptase [Phytophthora megakarya]